MGQFDIKTDQGITVVDQHKIMVHMLQLMGGSIAFDDVELMRIQQAPAPEIIIVRYQDPFRLVIKVAEDSDF